MTFEQKELVSEFAKSDYAKLANVLLEIQIDTMADSLKTFSLSMDTEKDFLALKYQLEGARKLAAQFKQSLTRLRASDLDGKTQ